MFRWRDTWKGLVLAAVTVVVIYVLVRYLAGTERFWQAVAQARWPWLALGVALVGSNLVLASMRWFLLLRALGYSLSWGRVFYTVLSSWPLALVIPSRAGDLARAVAVRDQVPLARGAGSVIVEKWIDVQSLCLLALGGSLWLRHWLLSALALAFLAASWGVVLSFEFLLPRLQKIPLLCRFEEKIRQFLSVFRQIIRQPKSFVAVSLLSLLAWCSSVGVLASLLLTFRAGGLGLYLFATWPFATFVGLLPITMAGMGTRDAAFVTLLQMIHTTPPSKASLLAATLGYSLLATWLPALLGLPLMLHWWFFSRKKQKDAVPSSTTTNKDKQPLR